MKAPKNIKEKAGHLLKQTSNFLANNIKSIYAILITSILFLGWNLKQQADYSVLFLEIEKSYIELEGNYKLAVRVNKEQSDFIDFQGEINHNLRKINGKHEDTIGRAGDAIQGLSVELEFQKAMVQKLVEYLKSIKEWPPKISPPQRPEPVDPDKII